jgi:hypothetical protein
VETTVVEDEEELAFSCSSLQPLSLLLSWVSLLLRFLEDSSAAAATGLAEVAPLGRETTSPSSPKVMTLRFAFWMLLNMANGWSLPC